MDAQPETTPPSEEKKPFNWWAFILWPFVILVLYILSLGPVAVMMDRGRLSPDNEFVSGAYRPLNWAYQETQLHKPLGMYLHLWVPDLYNKDGDAIWRQ